MNTRLTALGLTILTLTSASVAFAGDPTDPGQTSTGTSTISVSIPKLVKISGLRDFDFTATDYDGSAGGLADVEDVCVYSNMLDSGEYTVKLTGSYSGGSGFFVKHASLADTIQYDAYWNDQAGTNTSESSATSGVDITDQTGFSPSPTCADVSGNNARYRVVFSQARLLGSHTSRARPGSYTGTLTILITPE